MTNQEEYWQLDKMLIIIHLKWKEVLEIDQKGQKSKGILGKEPKDT